MAVALDREPLMTVPDVAEYLNVPVSAVWRFRREGRGPKATKVGRAIRFRPADVDAWLEACQRDHPSQRAKVARKAQKAS
jgi:excisionase family DNA binding protein